MNIFADLAHGFSVALTPQALLFCFIGVTVGTLVGALPGIGALATISMCLPLTFHLEPTVALIMLAGIYYGAQYGSSISGILMNIPGTPTAAVTCIDGYQLTKQGRAGPAVMITTLTSFVGGSVAILLVALAAPTFADIALKFGSPEYFSIMLLGLVAASTMGVGSPVKGLLMVAVGMFLGLIGIDKTSGEFRYTFGVLELVDGVNLIALAMGLFGVSEIMASIRQRDFNRINPKSVTIRSMLPRREDLKKSVMPTARGTLAGSFFGFLPGAGPVLATFLAYAFEKRAARDPSIFGKGAIEGVAAPEAANNSAVQAAFIPTLSLGLPGDAVMAVLLGALLIHGIIPGPQFIPENPEIFWGLVASFWIGNIMLLILNIPFIGIWVRLLLIPQRVLYPALLFFMCVGAYSARTNAFDVYVTVISGVIGYGMLVFRYPAAPLLFGFILGPLLEENFRRSMILSGGDITEMFARPISAVFLTGTIALLVLAIWRHFFPNRQHVLTEE